MTRVERFDLAVLVTMVVVFVAAAHRISVALPFVGWFAALCDQRLPFVDPSE